MGTPEQLSLGTAVKHITFIQPDGNFNSNPHLGAVLEHLCDSGYSVDLYAAKRQIFQATLRPSMRVELQPQWHYSLILAVSRLWLGSLASRLLCRLFFRRLRTDLVIGVDTNGMIIAAQLGRLNRCATAYISYEIMFASETGRVAKRVEIDACKNISFAVVQDRLRGAHLATENQIATDKLVYMPVAAAGAISPERGWLRQNLGIQPGKKIALLMGSLENWSGVNQVLDSLSEWPDDWCLVIHGREGLADSEFKDVFDSHPGKLIVSTVPFKTDRDLGAMLADVDLGLAFYYPDYASVWTGLNLKHLGMASGKISTFLRFGVPVMVNQIGEMADHVERNRIGHVVESISEVPAVLHETHSKDNATVDRCQSFFEKTLSASTTMPSLMAEIEAACSEEQR